ncbi:MAG: hypothetical protein PHF26_03435 [Candidatus Gracilibacteria bacterium]|nr:hypothetical protein [Candidatus Gracilibacteria bacterium]
MINNTAITIWVDESFNIKIDGRAHTLVGFLVTDSFVDEANFLGNLKLARKKCKSWDYIHSNKITDNTRKLNLINEW